jgi:hypothetical protein
VTVVLGEDSVQYGSDMLAPYLPSEQQQQQNGPTISPVVGSNLPAVHLQDRADMGTPQLLTAS